MPEPNFPSVDFQALTKKLTDGLDVLFKPPSRPFYIRGKHKRFSSTEIGSCCLVVEYEKKPAVLATHFCAAKETAFAQPLESCDEPVLVEGIRVVVRYRERSAAEEAFYSGTVGSLKTRFDEFLVFLDIGTAHYAKISHLHLIVQQPTNDEGVFDLRAAASAFPSKTTNNHEFVQRYLLRAELAHRWPRLRLDDYEEDSKYACEKSVTEGPASTREIPATILQVREDLILFRFPKVDKRLKQQNQFKQRVECRAIECTQHQHRDEWIHRGDITRFPPLRQMMG